MLKAGGFSSENNKLSSIILPALLITAAALLLLLMFPVNSKGQAANFTLRSDRLQYDLEKGLILLEGNLAGQIHQLYFKAEEIQVFTAEGEEVSLSNISEIDMEGSKLTGCDFDKPHYYFDARSVKIYPGDVLIARHVVFRELDGRLPLFYWPILIINLDPDPRRIVPEVGYSASRGWFIRGGYNYLWGDNPGLLKLEYYTRSGFAGGFSHHLVPPDEEEEIQLHFFTQENRENLPELFRWQAGLDFIQTYEQLEVDSWLENTAYQDYNLLEGELYLGTRGGHWLNLDFEADIEDERYPEEPARNFSDISAALGLSSSRWINYWNIEAEIDHERYPDAPEDNLTDLSGSLLLRDRLGESHISLSLDRDVRIQPEEETLSRWGGELLLRRRGSLFNSLYRIERDDPRLGADDDRGVLFYRLPELELDFNISGPLGINTTLGQYHEARAEVTGVRWQTEYDYRRRQPLPGPFTLNIEQEFGSSLYHIPEAGQQGYWQQARIWHESGLNLNFRPFRILDFDIDYDYLGISGETPFQFDELSPEDEMSFNLRFTPWFFDFRARTAYDFLEESFDWLRFSGEAEPYPDLVIKGETRYDIEEREWDDFKLILDYDREPWDLEAQARWSGDTRELKELAGIFKYSRSPWQIRTGLKMAGPPLELTEIDASLEYSVADHLTLEVVTSYDRSREELRQAAIRLQRHFHCRSLSFSYDHVKEEFLVQYSLDIFPESPITFGRSDEEPFLFDLGLGDIIQEED